MLSDYHGFPSLVLPAVPKHHRTLDVKHSWPDFFDSIDDGAIAGKINGESGCKRDDPALSPQFLRRTMPPCYTEESPNENNSPEPPGLKDELEKLWEVSEESEEWSPQKDGELSVMCDDVSNSFTDSTIASPSHPWGNLMDASHDEGMLQMLGWCPQAMDESGKVDLNNLAHSDMMGWWPSTCESWSGLDGIANYCPYDMGGKWGQADFACGSIISGYGTEDVMWNKAYDMEQRMMVPAKRVGGHRTVPRVTNFKEKSDKAKEEGSITTMMIRNLPNKYTSQMLVEELNLLGLNNLFDFVYVPTDQLTRWNVGYGFVNFINAEAAKECARTMTGYKFCRCNPRQQRDIQVVPAHMQGLRKNLEHYRRTAVQFNRDQKRRPMIIPEALSHLSEAERVDLLHEFGHLIQNLQR